MPVPAEPVPGWPDRMAHLRAGHRHLHVLARCERASRDCLQRVTRRNRSICLQCGWFRRISWWMPCVSA